MKKLLLMLLVTACVIGLLPSAAVSSASSTGPFNDVSADDWFYEYVLTAYEKEIMIGKSDGVFDPLTGVTRAEFVTVICRLSGESADGMGQTLSFSDTKKDSWYSDSVGWAAENGLVKGYPDNTFRPDAKITRQELSEFTGRLISHEHLRSPNKPQIDSFTDASEIPSWAEANAEKLRVFGLMAGDDNGNFNPTADATRAEVAKIASELETLIYKCERFKRFNLHMDFQHGDEVRDTLFPYRIYLPEDYDESKEYPLLLFLHANAWQGDDNIKHLDAVKNAFLNPYSPALDSIVVLPQCPEGETWHGETIDRLAEFLDYINEKYSTDKSRQYVSGISMGGDGSWQMMLQYPEKVTAIMPVAGIGPTFLNNGDGTSSIVGITEEVLKVPVHIVFDTDDKFSDGYYNHLVIDSLQELGGIVTYYETSGFGHGVCGEYASITDISNLEKLYSIVRETK